LKQVTDENGVYVFDPERGGVEPSILVYEGVEEVEEGGETIIEFQFHELQDDEVILANTPFLIKVEQQEKLTSRLHFWSAYFSSAQTIDVTPGEVSFVPVLAPTQVTIPSGSMVLVLVDQNRLAKVTSTGEMLGLRGYFVAPSSMANMPARIAVKESSSTDTEELKDECVDVAYKVLDDQRVYIIRNKKKYDMLGNIVR
jgi:hypothetical protein